MSKKTLDHIKSPLVILIDSYDHILYTDALWNRSDS